MTLKIRVREAINWHQKRGEEGVSKSRYAGVRKIGNSGSAMLNAMLSTKSYIYNCTWLDD